MTCAPPSGPADPPAHESGAKGLAGHGATQLARTATLLAIALATAALAAVLSLTLHPIEIGLAENDRYVEQAERLLRGESFLDGFHPALYVQLTAALTWLVHDAFVAARLVSALANGLLCAATFALARRLGGPAAGWLALAAVASSPAVLLLAMQASSDTLGAALVVATAAAAARAAATLALRDALVAGLCFGLATATRAGALAFAALLLQPLVALPIGALPIVAPVAGAARRRAALAAALLGGTIVGHLPHALAAWSQLGSPFASHNWRNTLLKAYDFDGRVLHDPPYASPVAFLRDHGATVLAMGGRDLGVQLGGGFGAILGSFASRVAGAVLGVAVVAALLLDAVRRPRLGVPLLLAFGGYLATLCFAFVPNERLLLPLVPLAFVALATALRQRPRWLAVAFALALAAAIASNARALPGRLRTFADAHPLAEVALVQRLAAGPDAGRIGSTYSSMQRHVPAGATIVGIWMPARGTLREPADAFAHLQRIAREDGVRHVVVGRRTEEHLFRLLHGAPPPPGIAVLADTADLVHVRVGD